MTQNQPSVEIEGNSPELNAFLDSLLAKGYAFDTLIDNQYRFYIISREKDNKMGLISEKGWYNGNAFGSDGYWFDGLDTQEIGQEVFIELKDGDIEIICRIKNGDILVEDGESRVLDVADIMDLVTTKVGDRLN